MKKTIKYLGILLSVVLMGALSSCTIKDINEDDDLGLNIKVFAPTKVVAGQPMTINGTGLLTASEIVFPGGIPVTNFEIVSNEMIRVTAPSGIAAEGGKLIVRSYDEEVESRLPLTLGRTNISGYDKQEGEEVEGGQTITIYGEDLEFINSVELLNAEGVPQLLKSEDFYRKGTSTVMFYVPTKNIYEGSFVGKIFTYDGREFAMPELAYKPKQESGHWETKKTIYWENTDGTPIPTWGGKFRFTFDGNDANNECIATFPADVWALIKDGTIRAAVEVNDASNIRITTGWWTGAYGGTDHNCTDMLQEEEDGTKYIELNIKEDGNLYDNIDQQHLLFTGDAYTLLYLYTVEEIWVPGEEGHWERNSYWKNTDGTAIPAWGGKFRFTFDGNDANNECIATFPADVWALIKDGKVRAAVAVNDASNIRITTGWWTGAYGGTDHNCIDMIQEEEDGTKYIELDIKGDGNLYDNIDQQHLLFTGDAYTLLEIYTMVWVEGGGGGNSEVELWTGEAIADDWGNQPNLLSDAGVELQEAGAKAGQEVRFYITPTATDWKLKIIEGHWGPEYCAYCAAGTDTNGGEFTEWDLDANGGYIPLTLTQEILDAAFTQQWWGGTFIANGDNVKVTKITLK